MKYIYQDPGWHSFTWCGDKINNLLLDIYKAQGYLFGKMDILGFDVKNSATLNILSENILKSSEIEGEILNKEQVRSSIARRLGLVLDYDTVVTRNVESVVEMMFDAIQNHNKQLSKERLLGWHASLFPTGYSGMYKIEVGQFRSDKNGPMQVISGHFGKEKIHYEAPSASYLDDEMQDLIDYINNDNTNNLIKSAIAHLWFLILHPFEDGNGRIARALSDMILAKNDNSQYRFYSMSSQIQKNRKAYYDILEKTQKGSMDITNWIEWFLENLLNAINSSEDILKEVLKRAEFWQKHINISFNERQKKVLNRFMDNFEGNLTTTKWAKLCGCSQDSATRDIADLIEKKILKKVGSARSTHYILL